MTIIVANSFAAVVVIGGLAAAMRFGHLTAGGRFEQTLRRFELHRSRHEEPRTTVRRAA